MRDSMPKMRQVWHVFAKDLRRNRWMLLLFTVQAFVALLGLTVQDLGSSSTSQTAALFYMALPITAAVLVAMIVLDDGPSLPRAWWASLALSREAVFGAKLLFAVGLVTVVMILAVGTMQWTMGVRGVELVVLTLSGSKWIFLTASMAFPLAALQHDLRSFLLAAVVVVVAEMLFLSALSSATGEIVTHITNQPSWLAFRSIAAASTMLLLLMTWRVYRRRSRSWKEFGVLLLLVAVTIVGHATIPRQSVWGQSKRLDAVTLRAALYETEAPLLSTPRSFKWSLRLEGLPPELRGSVQLPVTRFEGPTTCSELTTAGTTRFALQSPVLPLPGAPVRWRGWSPPEAIAADSVWTSYTPLNLPAPEGCTPMARGELHVHEPRFLASIPLAAGESFTRAGYRVSVQDTPRRYVTDARLSNALVVATLRQLSSIPTQALTPSSDKMLAYVLLHSNRREAIPLHTENESGYGQLGFVWSAEFRLVLGDSTPMTNVQAPRARQSIWQKLEFGNEAEFDAWLRGAELAVFEWKLVGIIEAEIVDSAEQVRSAARAMESVK